MEFTMEVLQFPDDLGNQEKHSPRPLIPGPSAKYDHLHTHTHKHHVLLLRQRALP